MYFRMSGILSKVLPHFAGFPENFGPDLNFSFLVHNGDEQKLRALRLRKLDSVNFDVRLFLDESSCWVLVDFGCSRFLVYK